MAVVMAVMVAVMVAVPPATAVSGPRCDQDGQDGENEEELADHTDLRSPEAARRGRNLAGLPLRAPEGSAGRQPDGRRPESASAWTWRAR